MPIWGAQAASALGAIGGAALGMFGGSQQAEASAKASKQMYKHRYQWQMEDMKKAGLNPMLAFAQGAPVPSAPQVPNYGDLAVKGAQAGFGAVQAARLQKAQIENVEADTSLKGSATALNVTSARESAIRAGINEANLPWAAGLAQSSALAADKNVAYLNMQIAKIGEDTRGSKLDNDQKEKMMPILLQAQKLINEGMEADLVRKEVYGRIWSIVPDQGTVDAVLNVLKDPKSWPERLHKWGKDYTDNHRPDYVQR